MKSVEKVVDFNVFSDRQVALFSRFDALGIAYEVYAHPPVFTVEEGDALGLHDHIPGQGGKSLLLTNDLKELWLVVACDQTRVDLKKLVVTLQTKRFSFAKPEIMVETMGVTPGSATPFALLHDTEKRIRTVFDEDFMHAQRCVFHPLDNRFSVSMPVTDVLRFMKENGHEPHVLPLA